MNFGNIQGLVSGVEQVVFDYEVTGSAVTSIDTGNILNGDEDGWYTIIARHVYDTADSTLQMYFNADNTAANYGYRGITAANTTVADVNSTAALIRLAAVASGTTTGFSVARVHAKQGAVRLLNGTNLCNINGTTVTQLETLGSVYSVTNTNITGMVFAPSAGKCGIGTRIIILKSNNFTGGTPTGTITTPYIKGSWVRVGSQVLGADASSVTFSSLDGDRDVVYLYTYQLQADGTSGGTDIHYLRFNSDTGTNYGYQRIYAASTTLAGARITGYTAMFPSYMQGASWYSGGSTMIFAKSGYVRPSLSMFSGDITGTTVGSINAIGQVWSNTASNLTSMVLTPYQGKFKAGSQLELYALRPGG